MEKLTLEHLAGYLPYGLKVKTKRHFCKYGEETILKVNGIAFQDTAEISYWQYEFVYDNDLKFADINEKGFKLILRTLKSMTPSEKIEFHNFAIKLSDDNILPNIKCGNLTNWFLSKKSIEMTNWLYKNHFDIHGLIDKNLAIDINTI